MANFYKIVSTRNQAGIDLRIQFTYNHKGSRRKFAPDLVSRKFLVNADFLA
jgi:hypothetical protein